jgi:hypothetical protein
MEHVHSHCGATALLLSGIIAGLQVLGWKTNEWLMNEHFFFKKKTSSCAFSP